jgi:hypothetical protein
MDAQALRFEGDIGSRTRGIDQGVRSRTGLGGTSRCIDRPFSEPLSGIRARFTGPGAAVLAGELAGLSRAAIHLGELNQVEHSHVRSRLQSFEPLPRNSN